MNRNMIILVLVALAIGFTAAWLIKPSQHQNIKASQHQTTTESAGEIWTCSMHPQIRQNEAGLCPICEMDLIPLAANTSNDPLVFEMTTEAVKLANIQTTLIGSTTSAEKSFLLSGKIQADERLTASQVAHIPGRIEQLFVTFTGEPIRKGQKLATLYSPELVAAQQELLEALKFQDINANLLKAARKKLGYWKIPTEQIKEIEESGQIQETFTLFAEASGVVTTRRVAVGDYVRQGEVLFDVIGLNRVWVLFDAYEKDLASIKVGDRIEFTTPAVPNKTFSTRITFIDPIINATTRVASLRGEISNTGQLLKPEMLVSGSLQSPIKTGGQLSVPASAVLWTGPRSVVYVKVPDANIPSFQFKEVELGERVGSNYLVSSGLEAGEEVVTYGNFTIDAAAQLNNQASMMNKQVLIKGQVPEEEALPDYTAETPQAFKQQLSQLAEAYLPLKDAFVATDAEQAKQTTASFLIALSTVDMTLVKDKAHLYWMDQLNALQAHGKKIAEINEIEAQRKQFDFLSQALIKAIKVFGIQQDTFYVQHCPMAFDDVGADWLSDVEDIQNPYFGDLMMKCGWVEDVIDVDFKNSHVK